ncbi:hypothetical protein BGZ96_010923 [Linnemannia gamsii]|uniref:Uncharacterized protein n=1 Tax=Linnemannia gamsii TaxID=64522 RepID=A0ABQ7KE63_9FUNG|nr:hypothetical protein BGZ96_010923 [Linnemannia gamsii]
MVDFGTTQPPKYSSHSGTIRQRNTTTAQSTTTQSDPPSPQLSQLDTPQPPQSPSSSLQEDDGGQQNISTLLNTYVIRPIRCFSILAIVLVLLSVSVSSWLSMACESDFDGLDDTGHQEPLDASEGSSSFPGRSLSLRTDVPDFTYLVNRQAAMFEAFSGFLTSLNTPIILEDKYHYSDSSDGTSESYQVPERDSYGLEARTAASGKEFLPLYMSMKMAELAVIDLKVAAKHSLLPFETRTLLVEHLGVFHAAAKVHTRKLQFLEARNKGWVEGVIVRNVYLSAELKRLEEMSKKGADAWTRVWRNLCPPEPSYRRIHARKIASVEKKLDRLFFSALKEDRKQLRMTILQVQELQQSLDNMDQTRQNIQDIMGHERGNQEQLARDIMAYVWTHLGGHQVEQETYRKNLALLRSMDKQQKLTGGHLQWILLELTSFEAELEFLWERMVDAGILEAQEGGSQGQGTFNRAKSPVSSQQRTEGQKKTKFSLHDEIEQIETVNSKLKARQVQVN